MEGDGGGQQHPQRGPAETTATLREDRPPRQKNRNNGVPLPRHEQLQQDHKARNDLVKLEDANNLRPGGASGHLHNNDNHLRRGDPFRLFLRVYYNIKV